MADAKAHAPVRFEVVAGTGRKGHADGALSACQFQNPSGLCRYGDSLIIADSSNFTIRMVEGVLGVTNPLANGALCGAEFEARAVPLIMTAIPALPKELAQLMAQYAHVIGRTRTIAGECGGRGDADGPALSAAKLWGPEAVALDTTDLVAGPQLIIGDSYAVRCLNLRSEMVTTIADQRSSRAHVSDRSIALSSLAMARSFSAVAKTIASAASALRSGRRPVQRLRPRPRLRRSVQLRR
jgi:hypothetical protein